MAKTFLKANWQAVPIAGDGWRSLKHSSRQDKEKLSPLNYVFNDPSVDSTSRTAQKHSNQESGKR